MITSSQKLTVDGDVIVVLESYANVNKYTRAGNNGKNIMCPNCEKVHRVHNFAWSLLNCPHCRSNITKYEWLVDQLDTWRTPR